MTNHGFSAITAFSIGFILISLACSLAHSLTQSINQSLTRLLDYSLAYSLNHSLSDDSDRHSGELLSASIDNNASRDFRAKLEEKRRFTDLEVNYDHFDFFYSEI